MQELPKWDTEAQSKQILLEKWHCRIAQHRIATNLPSAKKQNKTNKNAVSSKHNKQRYAYILYCNNMLQKQNRKVVCPDHIFSSHAMGILKGSISESGTGLSCGETAVNKMGSQQIHSPGWQPRNQDQKQSCRCCGQVLSILPREAVSGLRLLPGENKEKDLQELCP